jgi:MFS superfamily sulfate permease-like transporter
MAQGVGISCDVDRPIPIPVLIACSSPTAYARFTTSPSAILHGVWILAIIVLFPGLLRMVPICSLAGVLVFTGFNLIKVKDMRHLASYGRIPLLIYVATLITIVTTDLLTGVLVGVALSVLKLLYKTTHLQVYTEHYSTEGHIDLHLKGSATFIRIPLIAATLESIPEGSTVHVRTDNLHYIDHSCLDLMQDWIKTSASKNLRIVVEPDSLERKYRRLATT